MTICVPQQYDIIKVVYTHNAVWHFDCLNDMVLYRWYKHLRQKGGILIESVVGRLKSPDQGLFPPVTGTCLPVPQPHCTTSTGSRQAGKSYLKEIIQAILIFLNIFHSENLFSLKPIHNIMKPEAMAFMWKQHARIPHPPGLDLNGTDRR